MTTHEQIATRRAISKVFRLIREVANYYDVPFKDLRGPNSKRPAVYARRMAMALLHWHFNLSYSDIGRLFNYPDHVMAIYHIKNVMESVYSETHREFNELSDIIEFYLSQPGQAGLSLT